MVNGLADKEECLGLANELSLDTGFKDRDINRSLHSVKHITYGVFIKWIQSYTDQANGRMLCKALKEISRADLVIHFQEALRDGESIILAHRQKNALVRENLFSLYPKTVSCILFQTFHKMQFVKF